MDPDILRELPIVAETRELSRVGADILDLNLAPYQNVSTPEEKDHGIDGTVNVVKAPPGESALRYTGLTFRYQLKSTQRNPTGSYAVQVERRHLILWLTSSVAVVMFLVAADEDRMGGTVHWQCMDSFFLQWLKLERQTWREQQTVSIPFGPEHVFDRGQRSLFESAIMNWKTPLPPSPPRQEMMHDPQ